MMRIHFLSALISATILAYGCGPQPIVPPENRYTYEIDGSIDDGFEPVLETSKGPRPVAAMKDKNGVITGFVANEVILAPRNQAELSDFLTRHNGTILETDEIPAPPDRLGVTLSAEQRSARQYTIRLDPSGFDLSSFQQDAEAAGFEGSRSISSEDAARLLALMMHELRSGLDIAPNFLMEPFNEILWSTEEEPVASTFRDAFNWSALHFSDTMAGSKSSVTNAWQFLVAHGIERRVNVAIIDGGFWLDANGIPMSAVAAGTSDLPPYVDGPFQYDFDGDDYFAGGPNPAKCSGGSPCPWHGNQSVSTATAIINNRYGAAGTGGTVSEPFLFKADIRTRSQVARAVRTADAWGVDVVSMSFGGACNLDCALWPGTAGFEIFVAENSGLVFVAAAGNNNENLDDEYLYPCLVPGVICVGALNDGANTRISYSNYGSSVDLFAPTNIPAMPNGSTTPSLASAGGTSASTPFVAGIIAMMKALDPSLTYAEVDSILKSSAWTDSPDSRIPRYVNALAAVRAVAGNQLPPDTFEPNNAIAQAIEIVNGDYNELTIGPDFDYFRFTLSDFYMVDTTVRFMSGLGDVKFNLVGTGAPSTKQTITTLSNGRLYRQELMGPGEHTFLISSTAPNHYHLQFVAALQALDPDQFEVNDTLAATANPAAGSYMVNLHTASDVDHYAFAFSPPVPDFLEYEFSVSFSDAPLSLTLFRDGAEQFTLPPSTTPKLILSEPGNYVVRLQGSAPSRYSFRTGPGLPQSAFEFPVPVDPVWIIDPTGPVERWLIGERDAFTFNLNSRVQPLYNQIELVAEGLHLTLFDVTGERIAEGIESFDSDGIAIEALSLRGLQADLNYVIVVERTGIDTTIAGLLLPAVQFQLNWQ